jgi:hypothetical protein
MENNGYYRRTTKTTVSDYDSEGRIIHQEVMHEEETNWPGIDVWPGSTSTGTGVFTPRPKEYFTT